MRKLILALCAIVLFFDALPASAAVTGIVRGNVLVDNIPRANVTLTLKGEGAQLQTTTDVAGNYVFSQVPFGDYTLTAAYSGVPDRTLSISVASDAVLNINFGLGQLKLISNLNVTSRGGASGTPVSSNVLGRQQLAAMPTNDSLDRIIQTVPGIVRFSYNEPVAHGFHGVTYEIDGAPIPQATSSNFAELIDPKNIDSLEIFTGAFPAEYGGSRQGAVINIVSNRLSDLRPPSQGMLTFGGGNQGQAQASFDQAFKFGSSELFLNANSQHTNRGLDAPNFNAIHDNSSQSDEFLRFITPIGPRGTLSFDLSNQLAQFQIPINTDPGNPNDPVVSVPGTDDVQREYDRYANLNLTLTSKDGNGFFQLIPWFRFTRIAYDGDLANDIQATQPDPDTGIPVNLIGLRQDRRASYVGLRLSEFRASQHHAVKVGADLSREFFTASQVFGSMDPITGDLDTVATNVSQPGWQIGLYAQDKWSPSRALSVDYGVRWDHSTGFTSGYQISPRIGINVAPDGRNVVHFYYGRMYAAPQLEDVRQACVALEGCPTEPVYDLKPERDAYFEMGVAHTFDPSMTGYVNFFMRTAVNVLDTTQLLNTPLFAVFNNAIGRDEGVEVRLQGRNGIADSWFFSGTWSRAEAAGVSGSTFLFPPDVNPPGQITAADFQPEDHDQTYEANAAYTHRFGLKSAWFATLQGEYGTGYPVQFESGEGRLPAHLTANLSLGKDPGKNGDKSLGFDLTVDNLLNHQYIIKIANGFNTTQIANGRSILFRLSAPF
ncbi:MAG TPA: TonB-dependent receptor [Candidatus Rubrimentiphilum sp.]|nr:TonB-dependent receptor [Candidatus Rubrimentiphilum sp.]